MLFKKFGKELLLAVILSALFFMAADQLGNLAVQPNEITLSAGLMVLSLAILVLPALLGSIPSGFFIAKKTKDVKPVLFVPAAGAAIGGLVIMLLSAVSLLLLPDQAWQAQMAELGAYGIDFFAGMGLAEYKAMILFSLAFGAVFLALLNFAIGLAGGFIGSKLQRK